MAADDRALPNPLIHFYALFMRDFGFTLAVGHMFHTVTVHAQQKRARRVVHHALHYGRPPPDVESSELQAPQPTLGSSDSPHLTLYAIGYPSKPSYTQ
jgi:hypothetical protein